MPQPAHSSPPDSDQSTPKRLAAVAAEAHSLLRSKQRELPRDYFERLREREEQLRKHWPDGHPSGQADPHFDDLLDRGGRKLDRQLRTETADEIVSVLLKLVWLALGLILIWERLAG